VRIIGGQHRGLTLASVGKGDAAAHLRPTPDRVRESLFNVLMAYGLPREARVLDLFAGTGALGLEALSRGAQHVTFVDNGRMAQKLIRENITPAIKAAQNNGWIASDAIIVLEDNAPQAVPNMTLRDQRRYGDTHITILSPQ